MRSTWTTAHVPNCQCVYHVHCAEVYISNIYSSHCPRQTCFDLDVIFSLREIPMLKIFDYLPATAVIVENHILHFFKSHAIRYVG